NVAARFLERVERHLWIVPRAETAGRASADDEPLLRGHIGQRKLVGVQKSGGPGAPEPFCVSGVDLPRHRDVAPKRRHHRPQNVSTAAANDHKEEMHVTPDRLGSAVNWNGTT